MMALHKPFPMRLIRCFSVVATGALLTASSAVAQINDKTKDVDSPGLVIEAIAGWDGTVDLSRPTQISFLLSNFSNQPVDGHITVTDPFSGNEIRLGDVYLSPGSTRRFGSIQAFDDWYRCYAEVRDSQKTLWRREIALNTANNFSEDIINVLVINDSTRRLDLPQAIPELEPDTETGYVPRNTSPIANKDGRYIRSLQVKTWQVPTHPGPLISAQAMLFPKGANEDKLNNQQWIAVTGWLCQGGTIFVHGKSDDVVSKLVSAAPLADEPSRQVDQFTVRRIGLGTIYEYPQELFGADGQAIGRLIAETTAKLPRQHITQTAGAASHYQWASGRADRNRFLVVAFFCLYTLLSGVVVLFFFRQGRRRVGLYTVVVVATASVFSGFLGGFLRLSDGDLRWRSVTQAGAGGLVQVGKIEVQSAGGRNTAVSVQGEHPDLQFVGRSNRYYWNRRRTGFPAFTWQPNLAATDDNAYHVSVPMTPWGQRHLHATAFQSGSRRMDFRLEWSPASRNDGVQPTETSQIRPGKFSLKVVNHLPFDVEDCWLIVGVACPPAAQSGSATSPKPSTPAPVSPIRSRRRLTRQQKAAAAAKLPADFYFTQQLQTLESGQSLSQTFTSRFEQLSDWDLARRWDEGSILPPRVLRTGAARAWLVGRIERSPILKMDTDRTEFEEQEQLHFFIQEIFPEDMPDPALLIIERKREDSPADTP